MARSRGQDFRPWWVRWPEMIFISAIGGLIVGMFMREIHSREIRHSDESKLRGDLGAFLTSLKNRHREIKKRGTSSDDDAYTSALAILLEYHPSGAQHFDPTILEVTESSSFEMRRTALQQFTQLEQDSHPGYRPAPAQLHGQPGNR